MNTNERADSLRIQYSLPPLEKPVAVLSRALILSDNTVGVSASADTVTAEVPLVIGSTVAINGHATIANAKNIILGTTTGSKIGTATGQKLGFWNATPIVQPTTSTSAATLVSNGGTALTSTDTFDGYTLQKVVKALRNTGILA